MSLRISRHTCEDNIKAYIKYGALEYGLNSSDSGLSPVAGSCEHVKKHNKKLISNSLGGCGLDSAG
jgi:hypothetical protein